VAPGDASSDERTRGTEGSDAEATVVLARCEASRKADTTVAIVVAAQPVLWRALGSAKAKRGMESMRERDSVEWLGPFYRQGWRGMGTRCMALAACPGSAMVKLVTVTTCKAGIAPCRIIQAKPDQEHCTKYLHPSSLSPSNTSDPGGVGRGPIN
jgi:hypothetical protein